MQRPGHYNWDRESQIHIIQINPCSRNADRRHAKTTQHIKIPQDFVICCAWSLKTIVKSVSRIQL